MLYFLTCLKLSLIDNILDPLGQKPAYTLQQCTGSAEEVLDCMINILNCTGLGDCNACICDVIPQFNQKVESMPTENLWSKRKLLRLRWDEIWQWGREEFSDKITSSHPLGFSLVTLIFLDLFPKPFFQGAVATCLLNRSSEEVIECVSVSKLVLILSVKIIAN